MSERKSKFRNNHTMTILGIPAIVVLEPVHIHLEPAIITEVHIGNKELCDEPSEPPPFEYSRG